MRILIPSHRISDSFADNVAYTLQAMGHEVYSLPHLNVRDPRIRAQNVRDSIMRRVVRDYVTAAERQALAVAKLTRPHVVLAVTQQLSAEALRDFKRLGVRHRVAWWGDAPANMQQMGLLDDEWDALFLKDGDCVRKLRRVGLNAHLLHEAHNPDWHRPLARKVNDTVVVVGNFYGFRQFIVRRLIDRGVPVSLYGSPLPRWVDPEIAKLHHRKYLVFDEKSRTYGEGLACLNTMHLSEGNALNSRAFEIAGSAGLQLIEYRPVIEECFEPGQEVLAFDSMDELCDHVARARRAPEEAAKIRAAGHRRALAHHTYQHRLQGILDTIESGAVRT